MLTNLRSNPNFAAEVIPLNVNESKKVIILQWLS